MHALYNGTSLEITYRMYSVMYSIFITSHNLTWIIYYYYYYVKKLW